MVGLPYIMLHLKVKQILLIVYLKMVQANLKWTRMGKQLLILLKKKAILKS